MRNSLALFLLLSVLAQAQPSISSAVRSGTTMTISGTGFGTKAGPSPFKFQPFTATTQGQNYAAAGFDFVGGDNYGDANNYVDMADGVGGGSWLHITPPPGDNSFSHFGHLLPGVDQIYVSYWIKITRTAAIDPVGGGAQLKGTRVGTRTGTSDPVGQMYNINPKWAWSIFTPIEDGSTAGPTAQTVAGSGTTASEGSQDASADGNPLISIINGEWHYHEIYYRINTAGASDGVQHVHFDGIQYHTLTDRAGRTLSSNHWDYVQYSPGLSDGFDRSEWEARFSRIYTDTTHARAFLGNNASLASVTGRFLLPPTAWSATSISVSNVSNVPSGYNWAYVCDSNNSCNSSGYAFATAASGSRLMLFIRRN